MKRRICVVGAALSVFLLAIGVASATASKNKSKASSKPRAAALSSENQKGLAMCRNLRQTLPYPYSDPLRLRSSTYAAAP